MQPAVRTLLRTPAHRVLGPVIGSTVSVRTEQPQVVLTFDDGPLPGSTEQLAEVLADHDARAVFFVLMTRVSRAPGLVRDLAAAGHEIGLHGLDHRRITSLRTREADEWLRRAHAELTEAVDAPVTLFRPPHGAQNPATRLLAARHGLRTVLWSGTTWDWKDVTHEERVAKAMADARPGAILLAHDGSADASDLASEAAVTDVDKPRLLDDVLHGLTDRGLRATTLEQALQTGTAVNRLSFSR
ncbi:polysaccharide deacetylase family protein [Luteococcus sp. Sow4_B9]|uniref:polysaccharide deacetylase family protein n=1 Tax=Luteococcus sp. Sow4_B9 TaxID=3438792 RepID=UPI003F99ECA3